MLDLIETYNVKMTEDRGGLTYLALERLKADLMLTGTIGLHPIHGLMTDDPNGVETYQACMHISDEVTFRGCASRKGRMERPNLSFSVLCRGGRIAGRKHCCVLCRILPFAE